MKYIAIILFFFFTQTKEEILFARNFESDMLFGDETTLRLYSDLTYTYARKPNDIILQKATIIEGTYLIANDTIYFKGNKSFKKGILNQDFLELLGNNYKIKIQKNNTDLRLTKFIKIPSDFTIFTFSESFKELFTAGSKSTLPNKKDFVIIEKCLENKIKSNSKQFREHNSQTQYFKQCIFIANSKGEKEVWLQGLSKKDKHFKNNWQHEIPLVDDGGEYFFELKMNLTTGKVDYFYIHGEA